MNVDHRSFPPSAFLKRVRPAAVRVDDLVDLFHAADGFVECDDDAVVVGDVSVAEAAADIPLCLVEHLIQSRLPFILRQHLESQNLVLHL